MNLGRSSLEKKKNNIYMPKKNRFNYNLTDLFLDSLVYLAVIECRDYERMNTKRLYWFTKTQFKQFQNTTVLEPYKNMTNLAEKHYSSTHNSSRNLIKKSLQPHFYKE